MIRKEIVAFKLGIVAGIVMCGFGYWLVVTISALVVEVSRR